MSSNSSHRRASPPTLGNVDAQFDSLFRTQGGRARLPCDECTSCPHRLAKIAAEERAAVIAEGQMDLPIPKV